MLINKNTCSTCAFKFAIPPGEQIFCRRSPPVAVPTMAMTQQGPQVIGWNSGFPPVAPDWWCGEHPGLKSLAMGIMPSGAVQITDLPRGSA